MNPALGLAGASIGGLLAGAALPASAHLRGIALVALFVQTLIAVGGLAEARSRTSRQWAWKTLLRHHALNSLPLLGLGLALGLDTWLGAGTFLLGAVPPAIAAPSYVAACGGQVKATVEFCVVAYGAGILVTPALVFVALGARAPLDSMVLTLVVGLILPAALGVAGGSRLSRIPKTVSFTIVSVSALVLMLGMGPALREAVTTALHEPALLGAATAVAFGRCVCATLLTLAVARPEAMLPETVLTAAGKNAVLAAVIGYGVIGPLAALPALLGLFAEAGLVLTVSAIIRKTRA